MITKTQTKINSNVIQDTFLSDFIYQSRDYNKFSFIAGNRPVNENHILEVANSIKQHGYIKSQSILVTKDNFIIDGQHRFHACKESDLPVYFRIVDKNHDDKDLLDLIRGLQNTQRRWTVIDAVDSFALQENPDYSKIKTWHERYNISYSVLVKCFTGVCKGMTTKNGTVRKLSSSYALHTGGFKITDKQQEENFINFAETLNLIRRLKDVKLNEQTWINQDHFMKGLWTFLNSDHVKLSTFNIKLENHYHRITKQKDRRSYVEMFLHIYNFQNKQKISIKGYGEFLK